MPSKKAVMVAIPSYTGALRAETTHCLIEALTEALAEGWDFALRIQCGNAIVSRARNVHLMDFARDSRFTDLLFIDDDLAWDSGGFSRLLKHDVDLVAGAYPHRRDPLSFPVRLLDSAPDPQTGLLAVEGAPAGFMRLTRRCVETMIARHPHLRCREASVPDGVAYALFDFMVEEGAYWGEDYVFCRRWRTIGGNVWIDPDIGFRHIGPKAFAGRLGDHWEHER